MCVRGRGYCKSWRVCVWRSYCKSWCVGGEGLILFSPGCRYHLRDIVVGKIYFLLVRIKIKHMEIAIIKKETSGSRE